MLRPGGILRVATDVPGYAELIAGVVAAQAEFTPHQPELAARFADAAPTSRQAFCDEIGRPYTTFIFRKLGPQEIP